MTTKEIKDLRKVLHAVIDNYWYEFVGDVSTKESLKEAFRELIKARLWLGKLLEAEDEDNPYEHLDGNRKSIKDIIDTADVDSSLKFQLGGVNQIEKADQMREWIKKLFPIGEVALVQNDLEAVIAASMVYASLVNARMYLGMYLESIKEKYEEQQIS